MLLVSTSLIYSVAGMVLMVDRYRVILDEAQCIKNRNTLTSKAAAQLQSQYRLCMTGTPMQNSVEDLFP